MQILVSYTIRALLILPRRPLAAHYFNVHGPAEGCQGTCVRRPTKRNAFRTFFFSSLHLFSCRPQHFN
ncbi:hypothetical protein Mapa_006728 [Marchantia paleacea]|nr:hypothetical protein Mapa_006728 [Marchantia paleacea]